MYKFMKRKVIILGGGISGLSVAWRLAENGFPVEVIELNPYFGGLAGCLRRGQYVFDVGPHYFVSEHDDIVKAVKGLFEDEIPVKEKVKAKLFFNNRYVDFPFTAKSVLFQMGFKTSVLCLISYLKSVVNNLWRGIANDENQNIKDWAVNNFGEYLFDIFFKPYTENFWKMSSKDLSHDVIPSSRKMSFMRTLKFLVARIYTDISKKKVDTLSLIERGVLPCYYPEKGFGEISERIAKLIEKDGGNLSLGWKVEEVEKLPDNIFVVKASQGTKTKQIKGEFVISTIPLNKLIPILRPLPEENILQSAGRLNYLSLITVYFITTKQNILDHELSYWLGRPYHRLSEANKFSRKTSPPEENMLCAEISCYVGDNIWNLTDKEIFERCIPFLENDGILKRYEVKDTYVLRIPEAYPVYNSDYKKNIKKVLEYISKIENFETFGRKGAFYYDEGIDQLMGKGFDLADQIINREQK